MNTLTPSARRRRATTAMALTGLLSCGVLAMTANQEPAQAAIMDTCDAALITLHKVDSETGDNIEDNAAKFLVKTTGNVFLLPGDHLDKENDFRAAYDGGFGADEPLAGDDTLQAWIGDPTFNSSGTARDNIDMAQWNAFFKQIHKRGLLDVDSIPDPRALTDNDARSAAYASWINNPNVVAAQEEIEDIVEAYETVKAELDADERYQYTDYNDETGQYGAVNLYWATVDTRVPNLQLWLEEIEEMRTAYTAAIADPSYWSETSSGNSGMDNWEYFSNSFDNVFGYSELQGGAGQFHHNYYGALLEVLPSDLQLDLYYWRHGGAAAAGKDITDPVDFSTTVNKDASEAGADAIDAVQQAELTTNADGDIQFTLFGVKDVAYYGGTRGDDTCSQLVATAVETMAPDGYVLDGVEVNVSSTDAQFGETSIPNTKRGVTTDIPHFYYRTGL